MRAIHIFTAPVSARTMSSRPMAALMSATIRRGASGYPSSVAPSDSSSRSIRLIFRPVPLTWKRRSTRSARACRERETSPWTPTSTG